MKQLFSRLAIAWGFGSVTRAASLATLAAVVAVLPAYSAQLVRWRFDPETRQLEIVTPGGTQPNYFILAQPPRIVVDLPETTVGPVIAEQTYSGVVRQIRVNQFQPTLTRVVIELEPDAEFTASQVQLQSLDGNGRWIIRPLLEGDAPIPDSQTAAGGWRDDLADAAAQEEASQASEQPDRDENEEVGDRRADESVDVLEPTDEPAAEPVDEPIAGPADELAPALEEADETDEPTEALSPASPNEVPPLEPGALEIAVDLDVLQDNVTDAGSDELPSPIAGEVGAAAVSEPERESAALSVTPSGAPSEADSDADTDSTDTATALEAADPEAVIPEAADPEVADPEATESAIATTSEPAASEPAASEPTASEPTETASPAAAPAPAAAAGIQPAAPLDPANLNRPAPGAQQIAGDSEEPSLALSDRPAEDLASSAREGGPDAATSLGDAEATASAEPAEPSPGAAEDDISDTEPASPEATSAETSSTEAANTEAASTEAASTELRQEAAILGSLIEAARPNVTPSSDLPAPVSVTQASPTEAEAEITVPEAAVPEAAIPEAAIALQPTELSIDAVEVEAATELLIDPVAAEAEPPAEAAEAPEASPAALSDPTLSDPALSDPALSERVALRIDASESILIPAGTILRLRYPRSFALALSTGESRQEILLTTQVVQDQQGNVLLPAGAQVIGRFESGDGEGRFVAQALVSADGNRPLTGVSELTLDRRRLQVEPNQTVELQIGDDLLKE
ncbi:MAG: AMIN domain-containing protein [Elainellaceae cyanobacterium]